MSTNCVAALVILVFALILGEIRSTRSLCELGRYDRGIYYASLVGMTRKRTAPERGRFDFSIKAVLID